MRSESGDLADYLSLCDHNVFVTGKAGCGKSTILRRLVSETRKRMIVVAPTGIAAINVNGSTIHRAFQVPFNVLDKDAVLESAKRQSRAVKAIDTLVIDEVSMVRADLMDALDVILRKSRRREMPFGGVQVIAFGDLYQLPPVVTDNEREFIDQMFKSPYFFDSEAYPESNFQIIEMMTPFRQSDPAFLESLNRIREGKDLDQALKHLNARCRPDFTSAGGYVTMAPTNRSVDAINRRELAFLKNDEITYEGSVDGKFPESSMPTSKTISLRTGAQVMIVKNMNSVKFESNPRKRKDVANGDVGVVKKLHRDGAVIELSDGTIFKVGRESWDIQKPVSAGGEIKYESVGSFKQLPVKLGWAATIHKSQGKTFGKCVIDMSSGAFDFGQTYVALSRCSDYNGLILKSPLNKSDIIVDERIVEFMRFCRESGDYVEYHQDYIDQDAEETVESDVSPEEYSANRNTSGHYLDATERENLMAICNPGCEESLGRMAMITIPRMIDEMDCLRHELEMLKKKKKPKKKATKKTAPASTGLWAVSLSSEE